MNSIKQILLGVAVSTEPKNVLLEHISSHLKSKTRSPLTIVTPNPEQIVYAQKDEHFRNILNSADIALPDGVGIVWAVNRIKYQGSNIRDLKVIPGIEFMEELVKLAAENGYVVGLIGGRNGVVVEALQKLQQKFPTLKGWAEDGPEIKIPNPKSQIPKNKQFSNEAMKQTISGLPNNYMQQLIKRISETKVQLLFIGLGAPKQEYFVENLKSQISNPKFSKPLVLMSVGGSFDELSGRIPRPPQWVSNVGLKWLWRLILEPWRIQRQLRLITFIRLVLSSV